MFSLLFSLLFVLHALVRKDLVVEDIAVGPRRAPPRHSAPAEVVVLGGRRQQEAYTYNLNIHPYIHKHIHIHIHNDDNNEDNDNSNVDNNTRGSPGPGAWSS